MLKKHLWRISEGFITELNYILIYMHVYTDTHTSEQFVNYLNCIHFKEQTKKKQMKNKYVPKSVKFSLEPCRCSSSVCVCKWGLRGTLLGLPSVSTLLTADSGTACLSYTHTHTHNLKNRHKKHLGHTKLFYWSNVTAID